MLQYKKIFISGGAGFVGSNIVDRLLKDGHEVVVYDNFSTGHMEFLETAIRHKNFKLINGDVLDIKILIDAMHGCDFVFHMAANADVRHGIEHPDKDLKQNTIATFNVLEAMRVNGIKKIAFASTGSVYGEATVIPTPEDAPFPIQTSFYGASKLAGEGLIQAYSEGFGMQGWIFRFVSILGERYSHGHVRDFVEQLVNHPDRLDVLGDGHQKKSYLYVGDCIEGMMVGIKKSNEKVNIFNLGTKGWCEIDESIKWICEYLNVSPEIVYSGGKRGWVGDSPQILLDTSKINKLGWYSEHNIRGSIRKTVGYLKNNEWLLEK